MSQIQKELLNQELLKDKIKELEANYVAGLFQEYYYPLANDSLSKEILELEAGLVPEDEEEKKKHLTSIADRKKLLKTNETQIKAVSGTIEHLNKTLPYLKSFVNDDE